MTHRSGTPDTAEMAVRLAVAAKRFRSRIREEAGLSSTGLSELRLAILIRLRDSGPSTAACLAEAEHVTQQAIAQSLAALKSQDLVRADTDPNDRRKALTRISDAGLELLDSVRASRDTWLSRAIEAGIGRQERADLGKAIELLERLADIDPARPNTDQARETPTTTGGSDHTAMEGDSTK